MVDGLSNWGDYLVSQGEPKKASEIYYEGLAYARAEREPRNEALANKYIETALTLVKNYLQEDLKDQGSTYSFFAKAVDICTNILALSEHKLEHETDIQKIIRSHAEALATQRDYERAKQALDHLDTLLKPQENAKTDFAHWRRNVIFIELKHYLALQDSSKVIAILNRLHAWLDEYQAPQVTWQATCPEIVALVTEFYQQWLLAREWPFIIDLLNGLRTHLAGESQVIAWQVEALHKWGQALHQQQTYHLAIEKYQQALLTATELKTFDSVELDTNLLQCHLNYAQSYLELDDLSPAQDIFQAILAHKDTAYLGRDEKIRQAIKTFADRLSQSQAPKWSLIYQALDSLNDLNLYNEDVFSWIQIFNLQEIASLLSQNELEPALHKLQGMAKPWPADDVQKVVRKYYREQVKQKKWERAIKILAETGTLFKMEKLKATWFANTLTGLGRQLRASGELAVAAKSFEAAAKLV